MSGGWEWDFSPQGPLSCENWGHCTNFLFIFAAMDGVLLYSGNPPSMSGNPQQGGYPEGTRLVTFRLVTKIPKKKKKPLYR